MLLTKDDRKSQWCTPLIPVLRRQRQTDPVSPRPVSVIYNTEFLLYIVKPCLVCVREKGWGKRERETEIL